MMKNFLTKLFIIIALSVPLQAYADCLLNGKWYAEGTVINGKQCVNGEWV